MIAVPVFRDGRAISLLFPGLAVAIHMVQLAIDAAGMTEVPLEDRTRLLSDDGSGYVPRAFRDHLGLVGTRHILAAPYLPKPTGNWSGTIRPSSTRWTRSFMKCQVS